MDPEADPILAALTPEILRRLIEYADARPGDPEAEELAWRSRTLLGDAAPAAYEEHGPRILELVGADLRAILNQPGGVTAP